MGQALKFGLPVAKTLVTSLGHGAAGNGVGGPGQQEGCPEGADPSKVENYDDCNEVKNQYVRSVKMNKYFAILYQVVANVSVILVFVLFIFSLIDVFRASLSRYAEQRKSRKGNVLLYMNSLDKKLLTDKSFLIYKDSKVMDGIFTMGIIVLIFLVLNMLMTMVHYIIDDEAAVGNKAILTEPLTMYALVIVVCVVYYIVFYKIVVQKKTIDFMNQTIAKMDDVTKFMLSNMSQDYTFYDHLLKQQTEELKEYIHTMSNTNSKIKMIYTYNLFEYFNSFVPDFENSALFPVFSVTGVRDGKIYMSDYLKVGCNLSLIHI